MTPAEAARLLGHAAAFDNRTVGEAAARGWASALHDIPLDQDAIDAVIAFYGTNTLSDADKFDPTKRRWLEPHHVRYHRQKIRSARLANAKVMYDGNPDETAIESIENRRALYAAVGSGQLPPNAARAELTGGESVDAEGRGRELLRAVGRESLSRRPELAAPCPHCNAAAGRPCVNGRGDRRVDAHPSRIEASHNINTGKAPAGREEIENEIDRRRAAAAAVAAQLTEPPEPDDDFDPVHRTKAAAKKAGANEETTAS